jgi:16S rRNA (uracil1498-N3)-methyltransferase
MRRFFVRPEDVGVESLCLRGDEADHLARVLRLGPGARVSVFDGHGHEYLVLVKRLESDRVVCQVLHHTAAQPDHMLSIILGQGLPKAEKFEWVIQKTTELGVSEIVPVITDRVVPRLSLRQLPAKAGRWEKLTREACKQSGRATVPQLWPPTPLDSFFAGTQSAELKLILWEGENTHLLRTVLTASERVTSVAVLVGPEGGLTVQEVARGESFGFRTVGLGKRVLRTETAGVVAVAILQYQFGDLGA